MAHGRTEVDPLVPPLLLGHEQTLETSSVAGTIMTTQYIMGVAARPIKQMRSPGGIPGIPGSSRVKPGERAGFFDPCVRPTTNQM